MDCLVYVTRSTTEKLAVSLHDAESYEDAIEKTKVFLKENGDILSFAKYAVNYEFDVETAEDNQ